MNELSIIFHRLGLDTREVLAAAGTKWNFLSFEPGLVGGHCIGVDPYYLTYKAEEIGYTPQVILAGRQINDFMGKYVAEQTIKLMIRAGKRLKGAKVIVLGMAFKENVRDVRNTRVIDIYRELQDYELKPYVFDPVVLSPEVQNEYGVTLLETMEEQSPYDAMIIAVRHDVFSPFFTGERILPFIKAPLVLVDVKGVCDKNKALQSGFYWKL
ncbi:MAG: UDP binding domain-containing protein [Atribacterota bacterium]